VTAADLEVAAPNDPTEGAASDDPLTNAIALVMAAAYRADIFEAAKAFRGNRLGAPAAAQEAERAEAARKHALTDVSVEAYKRSGGSLAAAAPEDPVEALIFTTYEAQIRALQQALFADDADSTAQIDAHHYKTLAQQHRAGQDRAATMPRLGPVDAVNDSEVTFIFTADFSAERQATGDPTSANTVLTLSVSARKAGTEARIPMPPSVLPWVRVLLGPKWPDRFVRVDMSSVSEANPLTTSFRVFITPDGVAVDPPSACRRR